MNDYFLLRVYVFSSSSSFTVLILLVLITPLLLLLFVAAGFLAILILHPLSVLPLPLPALQVL